MLKEKLLLLVTFTFVVSAGMIFAKRDHLSIKEGIKRSVDYSKKNYNQFSKLMVKEGLGYQRKGKEEKAIDYFNRAIQFDLRNAEAYFHKGVSLFNLKRFSQAFKCFEKASELNPNYQEAIYHRDMTLNELLKQNTTI